MTPLSDQIDRIIDDRTFADFLTAFCRQPLGVIARGGPAAGGMHRVTASDQIELLLTNTNLGEPMIMACADPRVFAPRFAVPINAELPGLNLVHMLLEMPNDVAGILVCSAKAEISVPVRRKDAWRLVAKAGSAAKAHKQKQEPGPTAAQAPTDVEQQTDERTAPRQTAAPKHTQTAPPAEAVPAKASTRPRRSIRRPDRDR